MFSQEYQKPWPIQNLQALEHLYDDQSISSGVSDLDAELCENDSKQCREVSDKGTSVEMQNKPIKLRCI